MQETADDIADGIGEELLQLLAPAPAEEVDEDSLILSEDDEDDDDEDDGEYVSTDPGIRRYQEQLERYMKIIEKALGSLGYRPATPEAAEKPAAYSSKAAAMTGEPGHGRLRVDKGGTEEKNPFERGHKWGCGCPGCSAFRDSFYSWGRSVNDISLPDTIKRKEAARQIASYTSEHRDKPSEYPCGGKLRSFFRGRTMEAAASGLYGGNGPMTRPGTVGRGYAATGPVNAM